MEMSSEQFANLMQTIGEMKATVDSVKVDISETKEKLEHFRERRAEICHAEVAPILEKIAIIEKHHPLLDRLNTYSKRFDRIVTGVSIALIVAFILSIWKIVEFIQSLHSIIKIKG